MDEDTDFFVKQVAEIKIAAEDAAKSVNQPEEMVRLKVYAEVSDRHFRSVLDFFRE